MEASAKACPSALALDVGDTRLDYHGLLADVGAVGEELRSHGIGAGDRVGIRVPSGTAEDLVRLDDGVSVNRGCVLQTHLSTLGPLSIVLPGATVGDGTVSWASDDGDDVPAGAALVPAK